MSISDWEKLSFLLMCVYCKGFVAANPSDESLYSSGGGGQRLGASLKEAFSTVLPSDPISVLVWWSPTPTMFFIAQHQLGIDGHGWFGSPNGGMFILTQRDTSVLDVRPDFFVKHHTRACECLPHIAHAHTHTHMLKIRSPWWLF